MSRKRSLKSGAAPGPLELARFAEETTAIERALAALEKRLETLEGK